MRYETKLQASNHKYPLNNHNQYPSETNKDQSGPIQRSIEPFTSRLIYKLVASIIRLVTSLPSLSQIEVLGKLSKPLCGGHLKFE